LIFPGLRLLYDVVKVITPRSLQLSAFLTLCLVVCSPSRGENTNNVPAPDLKQSLEAGRAFQKTAEETKDPQKTAENYEKAIEQFRRAAALTPRSYQAHVLCGQALYGLALHTVSEDVRHQLVSQARDQYQAAAACQGAEWALFQEWGTMLTNEIDLLGSGMAQRRAILQEAIGALNDGLQLATFSGERAKTWREQGVALLLLAKSSPGSTNQRALYQQSIKKFESAAKIETESKTPRVYGLWGVALLELGKIDNDRMLMREAAERLQTAAQIDPTNGEIRYNLACTFALLDQPEDGMRHLKLCLDNDPDRTYFNAASKDPDLDNLRRTAEYHQVFPEESSDPQEIIRSQISNQ
jgi:tetratricopeptide (TPR) repeat protein